MYSVKIKRAYAESTPEDGKRILVDRYWPRGVKKEEAKLDSWAKEVCPSTGLRKWFDHREDHFPEFAKKYREELNASDKAKAWRKETIESLNDTPVTLIYAAKSETINHARVLKDWIEND
nr:DUF488 family protein [uncultured Peptoniphilus sp.]